MIWFRQTPSTNVHVNNPILFKVDSDTSIAINYTVKINNWQGESSVLAFEGILVPVAQKGTLLFESSINIAEILRTYLIRTSADNPNLLVSKVSDFASEYMVEFKEYTNNTLTFIGKFYPGGIAKETFRYLQSILGTDIFNWRIENTDKQFLLTTRTSGRHIVVKENELSPFFFIASEKSYRLVTEYGNTYDLPALTAGEVYTLDLEILRRLAFDTWRKLPSFIGVLVDGKYVFDITITPPTKSPNTYIIQFINSLGVFDKIAVTGKPLAEPELSGNDAFMLYREDVDDYIEQNSRAAIREIIKAECGYKTLEEFLFMRDMLQSDLRYLIDPFGNKREVSVKAESFSHDLNPNEPGSIQLKIRNIESDVNYSPEMDESPPDFAFGEAIWQFGITNGYGFLFNESTLNTV